MDLPGMGYSESHCEAQSDFLEQKPAWGLSALGLGGWGSWEEHPTTPSWVGEGHHTPASRALKAPDLCLCLCCHHR